MLVEAAGFNNAKSSLTFKPNVSWSHSSWFLYETLFSHIKHYFF